MNTNNQQRVAFKISPYIVSFLDIMGCNNAYKNWPEYQELIKVEHSDAIGRTLFAQHFIKESLERATKAFQGRGISFQYFSDSYMIYGALEKEDANAHPETIFRIFEASSFAMINSIIIGKPLRGGITTGLGSNLCKGNLCGPAIANAYDMERIDAKYPRVLVSNDIVKILKNAQGPASKAALSLVFQDEDEKLALDYAGKGLLQMYHKNTDFCENMKYLVNINFADEAHVNNFSIGSKEIAKKYEQLQRYFHSRHHLWG